MGYEESVRQMDELLARIDQTREALPDDPDRAPERLEEMAELAKEALDTIQRALREAQTEAATAGEPDAPAA
jgi:hypothetical protein